MGIFGFGKKKKLPVSISVSVKEVPQEEFFKEKEKSNLERSLNAAKTRRGLLPVEVLMLSSVGNYPKERPTYSRVWLYEFGIENPTDMINSLVSRNFVCNASTEYNLSKMKASDIKDLLERHCLPSKGKKEKLIDIAISEIPEDVLDKEIPQHFYALTDLGEQEVSENEWVRFLWGNSYLQMNINDFSHLVIKYPKIRYQDLIWGELNRESRETISNGKYNLYRNCRERMARYVLNEKKYDHALPLFLEVAHLDLNVLGLDNTFRKTELLNGHGIPEYIIASLKTCKENLGISDDVFFQNAKNQYAKIYPPSKLFSPIDSAGLLLLEINGDTERCNEMYKKAAAKL